MREMPKDERSQPLNAQRVEDGASLLPMLIAGLIMITIGYAAIMIFV